MAIRDERGRFIKRMKDKLAGVQPTTLEHMLSMPEKAEKEANEEIMEMRNVSVDVVPTKTNVRQSTRRSNPMSATITIIGNLTADPELRTTNSGKSVVNFSLANTPKRPDGSDGNTSFYNVAAWEYLADNFAASFKKGDRLIVIGRVSQDKWTDKDTEKVMSRLSVTADEIGGTCRFHTVEMTKVARQPVVEPATQDSEESNEDIFA